MRVGAVQRRRQLGLADVVRQRTDAEIVQLGLRQAAQSPHQQRQHADVGGVARAFVRRGSDGADRQLARGQHLRHQRLRQRRHALPGGQRITHRQVGRGPPVARRFGVLTLDQAGGAALRGGAVARGGGRRRRRGGARAAASPVCSPRGRDRNGRRGGIALLRAPAHAGQTEGADGLDLRRIGNAKARQRKRMRHPPQVEVNEHADLQIGGGDGGGGGSHGVVVRGLVPSFRRGPRELDGVAERPPAGVRKSRHDAAIRQRISA